MTNKLHVYYYIIYTTPFQDPVDFCVKITTSYNPFYQGPEDFRMTNKLRIYYYIISRLVKIL